MGDSAVPIMTRKYCFYPQPVACDSIGVGYHLAASWGIMLGPNRMETPNCYGGQLQKFPQYVINIYKRICMGTTFGTYFLLQNVLDSLDDVLQKLLKLTSVLFANKAGGDAVVLLYSCSGE